MSGPERTSGEADRYCYLHDIGDDRTRCGWPADDEMASWTTKRDDVRCGRCMLHMADEDRARDAERGHHWNALAEDLPRDETLSDADRREAVWRLCVMPPEWSGGFYNLKRYDRGLVQLSLCTAADFTRWVIALGSEGAASRHAPRLFTVEDGDAVPVREVARISSVRLIQLDHYGMLLDGYDSDMRRTVWRLEPRSPHPRNGQEP